VCRPTDVTWGDVEETVTVHDSDRGKFGGINCIVQFVFETNGRVAPSRVNDRCANMV